MEIIDTSIPDVKLLKPNVFRDERGYFFESFRQDVLENAGINIHFVQDNQSMSQKATLRGLHYQIPPFAQDKLVRVTQGAVIDVAVDIRPSSPTYGKHVMQELSAENGLQMLVPKGFAHGFLVLEDYTVFQYKCSNYYQKEFEKGLQWNDVDLGINWPINNPILSEKDKHQTAFRDLDKDFG
ncbi:MAG: dTDP-4-dehydrorhamnose 3,5-epimerase [Bacteroidetes bacterium]|nr:dTDP-4-dehydrorhamnose 3,5-epimerase [Bacteroidota bacterium]